MPPRCRRPDDEDADGSFLAECVAADPDGDGLSVEELYGLYLSWCRLDGVAHVGGRAFRAGLRAANVRIVNRGRRCPGLRMTGPAACDYLVHRELPLAVLEAPVRRRQLISDAVPECVAPLSGRPTGGVCGAVPAT